MISLVLCLALQQGCLVHAPVEMQPYSGPTSAASSFGMALEIEGGQVYVGDKRAPGGGKIYVYDQETGGRLTLVQEITTPDLGPNSFAVFAESVARDGDWLAVGKTLHSAGIKGGVELFKLSGGQWQFHSQVNGPPVLLGVTGDRFGAKIEIKGDRMLVGASYGDGAQGVPSAGNVCVFKLVNDSWLLEQQLRAPAGEIYAQFGFDCAFCGDSILVGSPWATFGGPDRGAVYCYDRLGDSWVLSDRFITDEQGYGRLGMQVGCCSGIAVASEQHTPNFRGRILAIDFTPSGPVILDEWDGGPTVQVGFGMDTRGNRVALGNPHSDESLFVLELDTTGPVSWCELSAWHAPFSAIGFGLDIALSDTHLAVGAPFTIDPPSQHFSTHLGAVHLFGLGRGVEQLDGAGPFSDGPILNVDCGAADSVIQFEIGRTDPGAFGALFYSGGMGTFPLATCVKLNLGAIAGFLPIQVPLGAIRTTLELTVPASFSQLDFYFQAAFLSVASPCGLAVTDSLKVKF